MEPQPPAPDHDCPSPLILVGIDASATSRRALQFAAREVLADHGRLVIAHVVDWSPYRSATLEENERRHTDRAREIALADSDLLGPAREEAERAGATVVATVARHGHVAETLMALAREHGAAQVVVGRTGDSRLRTLVFGSTPSHLVQVCTIPVTVVP
ncbi:universal stress protein [Kineosporia sp. R_H_3]|uniref:universal stress protein n=1 Tax=Kineosporia sp. R_H_3 TaxID=1961848 RepID=UPI000B4B7A2F|nr:universal stress protein [Kineosporia sp. R_H_3]